MNPMFNSPNILPYGYDIITDPHMTEDSAPVEVERTWKERLFTLPWRPFKKTKEITPKVPMKSMFLYGNTMIMNPETERLFRRVGNFS